MNVHINVDMPGEKKGIELCSSNQSINVIKKFVFYLCNSLNALNMNCNNQFSGDRT